MSSDGRYMYSQSGMNTGYDYSAYPPPPPPQTYENPQMAQPPPRPMRSSSSTQPQSPHQPYNPPTTSYSHPNYAPGPYMAPPPQHPQWTSDGWAQYNQHYTHAPPPPPPPPQVEGPYNPVPGRPETVPNSSMEARDYGTSNHPDPRRVEDRPPPPNPPPPQPTARRREQESPPAASPGTQTGLDFMKLLESYRVIIDAAGPPQISSRPPNAENFERMMQSATYGAQLFEAAMVQQETAPSDATRSPKRKEPEGSAEPTDGSVAAASKRQTEDVAVQEGQSCRGCNATSTPEWRRGPLGPRTLCNACGLVYAKLLKKRVRERVTGTSKNGGSASQALDNDSVDGDSDDDDEEYGSQDRRSDGGRD
ncbi:hypothetical protein BDZ94DRAFT_806745 [Collybia nuda]|uniref:GATA-type domain-containing protein n=1 Tax=Collybia nuda TaxID=64659 RepID=A0A9P6CD72_9AGAR|nr:hypothetical protein BDZ94DRAFT_806745 [Collybia nuda]